MRIATITNTIVVASLVVFSSCDRRAASLTPDGYKLLEFLRDVELVGMSYRLAPGSDVPLGKFQRLIINHTAIPVIDHEFESGGFILTRDFGRFFVRITKRGGMQLYLTDAQESQLRAYFGLPMFGVTYREARLKAEQGDAHAQYIVGECYASGQGGLSRDRVEAEKWFLRAAEQGHAEAQMRLVGYYIYTADSLKWLRKAADQGFAQAQYKLGNEYLWFGWDVPKNLAEREKWMNWAGREKWILEQAEKGKVRKDQAEGVKWMFKAAEQGHAGAAADLGNCYRRGEGVAKDETEAVKWYRKAAEVGNVNGLKGLGSCYAVGTGVSKDVKTAYGWFLVADEGEDTSSSFYSRKHIEHAESQLSPDQILEARNWAKAWRPTSLSPVRGINVRSSKAQ